MTTVDFLERVHEVLETGYTFGPFDNDASLIEAGYVDSVSIVGLTLELEKRFQIQIPPSEMTPENWGTARAIASMCSRLSLSASDGPPKRTLFDQIYGTANLVEVLRNELTRAGRLSYCVSLVLFQLEGQANDSDAGVVTQTWLEAGQALSQNLRTEDTVNVIKLPDGKTALLNILPHTPGASVGVAVLRMGRRLMQKMADRYPVKSLTYSVSTFPEHGREIQDLLKRSCTEWQELSVEEISATDAPPKQAQEK